MKPHILIVRLISLSLTSILVKVRVHLMLKYIHGQFYIAISRVETIKILIVIEEGEKDTKQLMFLDIFHYIRES